MIYQNKRKIELARMILVIFCLLLLFIGCSGDIVKKLIKNLKDEDWHVREKAAKALGEIKDERTVEPLITALKDEHFHVRRKAALVLGEIKDKRAVVPLIVALRDGSWRVRGSAACALGRINDISAVEPLITVLKDGNSDVRWKAALALDAIGGANAQKALSLFLEGVNLEKLAADYEYIIGRGKEGTEGLLIFFILWRYGNKTIAKDFLNYGNWELEEAAKIYMERYGHSLSSAADDGK